eukprot:GHVO01008910.1.p2 GENE.GHVO01008910.1~~GHVO01008910.1.p2  ORF type:complete len:126 (-),score=3.93 GHVO01008910.1:14-391(-)
MPWMGLSSMAESFACKLPSTAVPQNHRAVAEEAEEGDATGHIPGQDLVQGTAGTDLTADPDPAVGTGVPTGATPTLVGLVLAAGVTAGQAAVVAVAPVDERLCSSLMQFACCPHQRLFYLSVLSK